MKRSVPRTLLRTLSLLKTLTGLPPSKNPSKKPLLLENLLKNLLRSVLLHDPLGVHPISRRFALLSSGRGSQLDESRPNDP